MASHYHIIMRLVGWAWHLITISLYGLMGGRGISLYHYAVGWVGVASHYYIIMRLVGRGAHSPCDPQVQIVDGAQGRSLWEAEFVCPRLAVEDSSVLTASGQSVFLFWAGDPLAQPQNVSKATHLCRSHDRRMRSERRLIGFVFVSRRRQSQSSASSSCSTRTIPQSSWSSAAPQTPSSAPPVSRI